MKKIKSILVAILVMFLSQALAQTSNKSIFETKDSIKSYLNMSLYKFKFNENESIFYRKGVYEFEKYFNGILQEFNVNIGIVSGGGYTNFKLNKNIQFKIKYGSLNLDNNFSKAKTIRNRGLNGKIFGADILLFLKKKSDSKLFISLGQDWIKINNGKNISRFKVNIGIKSNN